MYFISATAATMERTWSRILCLLICCTRMYIMSAKSQNKSDFEYTKHGFYDNNSLMNEHLHATDQNDKGKHTDGTHYLVH